MYYKILYKGKGPSGIVGDKVRKSQLGSLHHVDLREQTQVVEIISKHLYQLSQFTGPSGIWAIPSRFLPPSMS